ncbi:MAG: hypothetical protein ABI346_03235 [Candidatus Baltobacteraceae bacterium]
MTPATHQLAIAFAEPTIEQLTLELDGCDPGSPYSQALRAAFEAPAPWSEQRLEILRLLAEARRAVGGAESPRLAYYQARLEDREERDAAPVVTIERWKSVNDVWCRALGLVSGDACAHVGKAYLRLGDGDAARDFLDAALVSFERAVRERRRPEITARADRQWSFDVKLARARAQLVSIDPQAFVAGILGLFELQTDSDALARGGRGPADEARDALERLVAADPDDPRLSAALERLTERCPCGSRIFAPTRMPLADALAFFAGATRKLLASEHATAFELASALWRVDGERFADLLAAVVARAPVGEPQGVRLASSALSKAEAAFERRAFEEALDILATIERETPEEAFRVAYWRGQCLRHLDRWVDAAAAFREARGSPDPLLQAWARFRSVECSLRIGSVLEFFERDGAPLRAHLATLLACRETAPNSRRIAFATACALAADERFTEALAALDAVDVSFGFHRAAQWLGCLAALQVEPPDWEVALRSIRRIDDRIGRTIPVTRAAEIFALCERDPECAAGIANALFGEATQATDEVAAWAALLEDAVLSAHFSNKHLLAALDRTFERALADGEPVALLESIAEARLDVAADLGAARRTGVSLDNAKVFGAIGDLATAQRYAVLALDQPALDGIPVALEAASLLRSLGKDDEARTQLERWRSTLAANREAIASLDHFLGDDALEAAAVQSLPGSGKRIALFGGHARQRTNCLRELEALGFRSDAIAWRVADEGQNLRFSDCEQLLKGTSDYFIVVTSTIGHATSTPIIAYLRGTAKRWWPLAVNGYQSFGRRVATLLREDGPG